MNTSMKIAAVLGIVGIVALVGFAGAAAATGSMPGLSGTSSGEHMSMMSNGDVNCMMDGNCQTDSCTGAQCQGGNASCADCQYCTRMMNGQCHSTDGQVQAGQYGHCTRTRSCC